MLPMSQSSSFNSFRIYSDREGLLKTYMIDVQPKDPFVLWLITEAQYFSNGALATFPKFSLAYAFFWDQSLSWHLYIHTVSYVCLWMVVMEFLITSLQPMGRELSSPEMSKVRASHPNGGIQQ